MKNKVTKSFALDQDTIEVIHEIKKDLKLKNDSEVITYAIFDLLHDVDVKGLKARLEQEIAKRKYAKAIKNTQNVLKKLVK